MTFIKREELPAVLRAAYDEAAKGVENDITRKNGKNDDTKVDSPEEVLSLFSQVDKLYKSKKLSEKDYQNFYKSHYEVFSNSAKIYNDCLFDKINKVCQERKQKRDIQIQKQTQEQIEAEKKSQLRNFKQEHPNLTKIDNAISYIFGTKGNFLFETFYFEEPTCFQYVLQY